MSKFQDLSRILRRQIPHNLVLTFLDEGRQLELMSETEKIQSILFHCGDLTGVNELEHPLNHLIIKILNLNLIPQRLFHP